MYSLVQSEIEICQTYYSNLAEVLSLLFWYSLQK